MSRISRYQNSVRKYIIANYDNLLYNNDPNVKKNITDITEENDHLVSVFLLTIMKNRCEKHNISNIHGYQMAHGVELLMNIVLMQENKEHYLEKYSVLTVSDYINKTMNCVNVCLINNIEMIHANYTGNNYRTYMRNVISLLKIVNQDMSIIINNNDFISIDTSNEPLITKTDVMKYKFKNIKNAMGKLKQLKRLNREQIDKYMTTKYELVCSISIISGLVMGGDTMTQINMKDIKTMSKYFAQMIKCVYDFSNLEMHLERAKIWTTNFVINFGFQNTFEIFMNSKNKFIEMCLKHEIYTNTVKEIIDHLESKLDYVIELSSPDVYSNKTINMSS